MKKNTILYLLLLVLIIMNVFFLINYLGRPNHKGPRESSAFIVSELNFNDSQLQQFKKSEAKHMEVMRRFGDQLKSDKDQLFNAMQQPNIDTKVIDGLFESIAKKETTKEKEMFYRLRRIYQICNEEQKKRFTEIIKNARQFDGQRPPGPSQRQ